MSRNKFNSDPKMYYSQDNVKKVLPIVVFVLVSSLFFTSCAYYNYLYHAKKHFETGEKELREKPEGEDNKPKRGRSSAYKKAIESAGRMLEFYPDSRWEEEALLLLAKSYYRTNQFRKSISKVDEMFGKYPESEFLEEAILWKGMSLLKVAQPDSARAILSEDTNNSSLLELKLITHKALGDYYYSEERWETAKKEYKVIVDSELSDEWLKGRAIIRVSDCLRRLERNEEALNLLNDVLARKPRGNTKFEASFQKSRVLYVLERYEEAYDGFKKLLRDGSFESEFPRVELEVARCEVKIGKFDDGKDRLEEMIDNKSRGEIAAEAQFELGMLYWDVLHEITKAHEAMRGVKTADRKSRFTAMADSMLNQIETLSGFWQRMGFIEQQFAIIDSAQYGLMSIFSSDTVFTDTLKAAFKGKKQNKKKSKRKYKGRNDPIQRMVDEARKAEKDAELALDSAVVDTTAPLDSTQIAGLFASRNFQKKEVVNEIANHYLFIAEFRDSSLYFFNNFLEYDLDDEEWGKAISSISHLYFVFGDTIRQQEYDKMILERLSEGNYVKRARQNLGLPPLIAEIDTFDVYFQAAENLWFIEDNPGAAREVYINISEIADSSSDVRARALYASAYLSRHFFGEDSIAQGYYKQVQDEFSGSDIARSAKRAIKIAHVNYVGKKANDDVDIREEFDPVDDIPDDFQDEFMDDPFMSYEYNQRDKIYEAKDVDGIPELTTPRSMLETLQATFYPFMARADKISGEVELEFLVGIRGRVSEIKVITEEPPDYEFGEAAIEVLKKLEYRGGRYRGKRVIVKMNQRFAFDPNK